MSNNYIATKGDVKKSHQTLSNEIYTQTNTIKNTIKNEMDQVYKGISQQINYIQQETDNKLNELSGKLYEQNKKFEDLQKTLENPLATQSNEMRNRAIESFKNNWLEEAEEEILKALELNNKDYISYLILARILKKNGLFEKSIEHYDKAIKYAAPYDSDFVNETETEKAISYMEEGRKLLNTSFDKAIKYFDIATKKDLIKYNSVIFQQLVVEKSLIYYQYSSQEKALEILLDTENYIKKNNLEVISSLFYYETLFYLNKGNKEKALEKLKECFLSDLSQENRLINDKLLEEIIDEFKKWLDELKNKESVEIEKLKPKLKKEIKNLNIIIRKGQYDLSTEDLQHIKELKTNIENSLQENLTLYRDFINLRNYLNNLNNQIINLKGNLKNYFEKIARKKGADIIFPILFIIFGFLLVGFSSLLEKGILFFLLGGFGLIMITSFTGILFKEGLPSLPGYLRAKSIIRITKKV